MHAALLLLPTNQLQILVTTAIADTPRAGDQSCTSHKANKFCRCCLMEAHQCHFLPSQAADLRDIQETRRLVPTLKGTRVDKVVGLKNSGSPFLRVMNVHDPCCLMLELLHTIRLGLIKSVQASSQRLFLVLHPWPLLPVLCSKLVTPIPDTCLVLATFPGMSCTKSACFCAARSQTATTDCRFRCLWSAYTGPIDYHLLLHQGGTALWKALVISRGRSLRVRCGGWPCGMRYFIPSPAVSVQVNCMSLSNSPLPPSPRFPAVRVRARAQSAGMC
jgi:hypothetical protein